MAQRIPDFALAQVPGKAQFLLAQHGALTSLGGDPEVRFVPEVLSSKWGGEAFLRMQHLDALRLGPRDDLREVWVNGKKALELPVNGTGRTHRFIESTPINEEDGGLEWDIEYASPAALPQDGVERFLVEYPEALEWHYQPPLPPEDIEHGSSRPDHIVGSYAAYWPKQYLLVDSNGEEVQNYETGKVAHIHRPVLIDAAGNRGWCWMNIEDGILSIHLDPVFLQKASYPVLLDPTLGYAVIGATSDSVGSSNQIFSQIPIYTGPSGKKITHVSWYTIAGSSIPHNFGRCILEWDDDWSEWRYFFNGQTTETALTGTSWKTLVLAQGLINAPNNQDTCLGIRTNGGVSVRYDTATNDWVNLSRSYADGFPYVYFDVPQSGTRRYSTYMTIEGGAFIAAWASQANLGVVS